MENQEKKLEWNKIGKNLAAFRSAFDIPALLRQLKDPLAHYLWLNEMSQQSYLPEKTLERLEKAGKALGVLCFEESAPVPVLTQENDPALYAQLLQWQEDIKQDQKKKYQAVGVWLLSLMAVADRTASEEDTDALLHFLSEEGYLAFRLELRLNGKKQPLLYYRDKLVTALPAGEECRRYGWVTGVTDPESGGLGITREGKLDNRSAFPIPTPEKRPVKVLLSRMCYVILLEDGSLLHNLRFSPLPERGVKDVKLVRDRISWTDME